MENMTLPRVQDCSVSSCSYNTTNTCGATAVTIGYAQKCATFVPLSVKGGLDRVTSYVGACQKADCTFNTSLECTASSVRIGASTADCLTYEAR